MTAGCSSAGERPLPATGWTLERHGSTRRPPVQRGDLAICYASAFARARSPVEQAPTPSAAARQRA